MIIIIAIIAIISIFSILLYYYLYNQLKQQQRFLNEKQKKKKKKRGKLTAEIASVNEAKKELEQKTKKFNEQYEHQTDIIQKKIKSFEESQQRAYENAVLNLEYSYKEEVKKYENKKKNLQFDIQSTLSELNKLKETKAAAFQIILKQQEVKDNLDNFRLLPTPAQLSDIRKLEKVKLQLNKPRILSMLIWQTFWQPYAKVKFPIILKGVKTGVYKITNSQTNQCYIGQSVDLYKRWCQHCKAGLGIDTPQGNKLYRAIQDYGLENFTFEVVTQCKPQQLNEKEKYFIELYQADTYGYNGNIGVNKK